MIYEALTVEQLRIQVMYSSMFEGNRENVKSMDKSELIVKLKEYDSVIAQSGYIYGGDGDLARMCQTRGYSVDRASEDRMRAMLRNGREDTAYFFVDWNRVYIPFGTTDTAPVVTLSSLNYRYYNPKLLINYVESSALCGPEDKNPTSLAQVIATLRRFDIMIEESNYELGNRSDIVRICQNKVLDYSGRFTSILRDLLREMRARGIDGEHARQDAKKNE